MSKLYNSNLGEERIGKKARIRHENRNTVYEIDVIAVDHRRSYGYNEFKVQPIGDNVTVDGWVRNLEWYRSDNELEL